MTLHITSRSAARAKGDLAYHGTRCGLDGSFRKYTASGKCVECETYRRAVSAGRVEGVDMRTEEQKRGRNLPKLKSGWNDEAGWTEEMRREHAEAIKRGRARAKVKRASEVEARA